MGLADDPERVIHFNRYVREAEPGEFLDAAVWPSPYFVIGSEQEQNWYFLDLAGGTEAVDLVTGVDLTAIEGIDEMHALTLVSELGTDFSKWPTVKQFTSWLGLCPNFKKTGGKVQSSKTRRGKGRAAHALRLAAWSLMRSRGYLGAYLRRQRARLGAQKAITAAAQKLARIVYKVMRFGVAYMKQTEEAYAEEVRERLEKQFYRRAEELGFEVKRKQESEAAPVE